MFFVLSKVLYFLLIPAWWIVILLIWRWRTKKPVLKRRLTIIVLVLVIIFTNNWLYEKLSLAWQTERVELVPGKTYDAAILLGGLSGYDKNNVGHFGNNADRFIQTANLYHRGIIKKIIISGGSGSLAQDTPPETTFLRQEFINNGINDSVIIDEFRSRNTYENAVYSKRICDSLHIQQPVILVTSVEHMRRSISVFKKAGFDFIPYPCDYKVAPTNFSLQDVFPDFGLFFRWPNLIKEVIGLNVYRLTGKA